MEEANKKLETKRILIYIGITFLLTYGYSFGVIYPLNDGANIRSDMAALVQLAVALIVLLQSERILQQMEEMPLSVLLRPVSWAQFHLS